MTQMTLFEEEQRFRQIWLLAPLWLYFVSMTLLTVYSLYRVDFLNDPMDDGFKAILLHLGISIIFLFFIRLFNMTTQVRTDGIYIRYFPLHPFRGVLISLSEVVNQEPVTYRPILEYGGWGIRRGWGKNKKCYNVSGNRGVLLTFRNGGTLLIGSRQPEMLSQAISSIMG